MLCLEFFGVVEFVEFIFFLYYVVFCCFEDFVVVFGGGYGVLGFGVLGGVCDSCGSCGV